MVSRADDAVEACPRPSRTCWEGLEVRYLANRDDYLDFALLTDLLDAAQGGDATRRGAGCVW